MTDVHSHATRSYNMSRIKARDTKPEMLVRRFLHAQGLRYKLHDKTLPGKPDLVFPRLKTVLFIHGCFWHGHAGCRYFVVPKTRTDWWMNKISRNTVNDEKAVAALRNAGWKVMIVWECDLKPGKEETTLRQLLHTITA